MVMMSKCIRQSQYKVHSASSLNNSHVRHVALLGHKQVYFHLSDAYLAEKQQ